MGKLKLTEVKQSIIPLFTQQAKNRHGAISEDCNHVIMASFKDCKQKKPIKKVK